MNNRKLSFQNPDGSSNMTHTYEEDSSDSVLVIFPAMGVKASYYSLFAGRLAKAGYIACTVDLRGNGESSIRPSRQIDFGYLEMLDNDYSSALNTIRNQYPGKKILLVGHSLGGQLACLFATSEKQDIAGIILIATCSVFYKSWKGLLEPGIWLMTQSFNLISKLFGYFPGKKIGFGGREARSVISDWSRQARTGNYILGPKKIDFEQALRKLNIPILSISIENDGYAPKAAVEHLNNKLGDSHNLTRIHIEEKTDSGTNYDHFNWTKDPELVIKEIKKWLENINNKIE